MPGFPKTLCRTYVDLYMKTCGLLGLLPGELNIYMMFSCSYTYILKLKSGSSTCYPLTAPQRPPLIRWGKASAVGQIGLPYSNTCLWMAPDSWVSTINYFRNVVCQFILVCFKSCYRKGCLFIMYRYPKSCPLVSSVCGGLWGHMVDWFWDHMNPNRNESFT